MGLACRIDVYDTMRPVFSCEICGEQVDSRVNGQGPAGYVLWWGPPTDCAPHEVTGPFTVHPKDCMQELERQHDDLPPRRMVRTPLEEFITGLVMNTRYPYDTSFWPGPDDRRQWPV